MDGQKTAGNAQNALLTEALRLADLGYRVFPCKKDKAPLTKNGCLDASSDPDQIRRWWAKWPTANIAISTDELWVVDVDVVNGVDHPWYSDETRLSQLAMTDVSARTPRGGSHHLFRMPYGEKWAGGKNYFDTAVDVKGWHGYILAAPSVTADGAYTWAGHPINTTADNLPLPPPAFHRDMKIGEKTADTVIEPGNLAGMFTSGEKKKEGEGRNDGMVPHIGRLAKTHDEVSARVVIDELNLQLNDPPLTADEIDRTLMKSFRKYRAKHLKKNPDPTGPDKNPKPITMWQTPMDLFNDKRYSMGMVPIPSGFDCLDTPLGGGFRPECFYIVAGKTGSGKSTLALNIARIMALNGTNTLVFKLEESTREALWRIHAATSQVDLWRLMQGIDKRYLNHADYQSLRDGWDVIKDIPLRFSGHRDMPTIRRIVREHVATGGKMIVVDQVSMMQGEGLASPYERITAASNLLRELAVDFRIPILLVAQVNREASRRDTKKYPFALDVNDLRDSGSLENDASAVIFTEKVYLGPGKLQMGLTIQKNRYGPAVCAKDVIIFDWLPKICRIDSGIAIETDAFGRTLDEEGEA